MIGYKEKDLSKSEQQVQMRGTHILQKELDTLHFSVWPAGRSEGHSRFTGNLVETAQFLENQDLNDLEVSALDLAYMRSLEPVPADDWLVWYYQTALSLLEENDFDEDVLVPYPTKSITL